MCIRDRTTDVVTYCNEASNQKSKYAYRKIFFYKKSTGYVWQPDNLNVPPETVQRIKF